MKDVEKNGYIGWCQKKAHEEIEYIFQELMPKHGLNVRLNPPAELGEQQMPVAISGVPKF